MNTELFETPNGTVVTCPDINEPCILPTDCIHVFHTIFEINGDYVRKQR
jgi:hypothetical protein